MARGSNDAEAALRWARIAKDYETLAEAFAAQEAAEKGTVHTPMQQNAQPIQQQQSKIESEDKE